MITHPIILSVIVLDVVSLFFLSRAALGAVSVQENWERGSSSRRQIRIETTYKVLALGPTPARMG